MRISDWSSDVCSSDLFRPVPGCPPVRSGISASTARTVKTAPGRTSGGRSEERRVGKACVSTCRSRGSPDHSIKHQKISQRIQNIIYQNLYKNTLPIYFNDHEHKTTYL